MNPSPNLIDLKELLLNVLENAFKSGDISVSQQLGVQMSNAIKKDGVTIIQNQNLEIYANIVPNIIKAIRMCDQIDTSDIHMLPPGMKFVKTLPEPEPEPENLKDIELPSKTNAINSVCEYFFVNGVTWQGMITIMKTAYLKFILSKFNTQTEAAKFLSVGPSYLSNLIGKGKEKDRGE